MALLVGLTGCIGEISPSPHYIDDPGFGPSSTEILPGTPVDPVNPAPPIMGPSVTVDEKAIEPGRVVAHRLNRVEYNNTVRDLFFGLDTRPADGFPIDNFAEGFDNNAQELRMSNLLMEKYLDAADKTVAGAFANPGTRTRLVACDLDKDASCSGKVLTSFLERAFRRPVAAADLAPYQKLIELARSQGDSAEAGIQLAMRAALVSPSFLYRVEPDPPKGSSRMLGDFELASRLSYFLWSSMPDDELFARGRMGMLKAPDEILRQTRRMLADPRANALVDNLAGQWLYGRQIPEHTPDPMIFPEPAFDPALRDAMRAEMTMFLRELLFSDRSAMDLLRADYTFANRRLAEHYGLPDARSLGTELKRVSTAGTVRGGLFSQAGWLTVTSHADSTSPIKRGKWILSELLCVTPPVAPPGVGDLEKIPQTGTLRERLSAHVARDQCKGCHSLMDPMGFGLENFDAIGRWRDQDEGVAIDASGTLPGTTEAFKTPAELASALQKDPRLASCLTRKLLTYAVGRGMEATDAVAVEALTKRFSAAGHRFKELLEIIATSPLMTMRGGNSEP